jgi:xanthine dehydrogenase molybdenum-binding subunit
MSQKFTYVGQSITQKDVLLKATGEARYVPDVKLPGMLWGKVLHSPYPHANIKKVDKSKAEKLPGVAAVLTVEDTPKILWARSFRDMPMAPSGALQRSDEYILSDKARYVGDPIAAVAAVDEKTAEEALELIDIEYEQLPFVIDPLEAIKPGAPVIHDYAKDNVAVNIAPPPWLATGDVEKGFAESDVVIEEKFFASKQVACQMETQSCVANVDASGKVTCYSPCQLAHPFRRELGKMFNIPVGKINVVSPFVGGSFGCRLSCHNEPICVLLAMKTHKPVKLVYSKEEDFISIDTRTPDYYTVKMGFKKDGTLHAMTLDVNTWAGGYLSRAQLAGGITFTWGLGHYRCPNMNGTGKVIYTNTTVAGAMRGFGNPEIMWGIEEVVDMAAEKLGIDPTELRLKNTRQTGEMANMGLPIESSYIDDCIREGAKAIDWSEKRGKNKGGKGTLKRGVGMATMTHCSGAWPLLIEHSNAFIKFNEDGTVDLTTNPGSPGTHIWGTLSQIAAEVLGIPVEDIYMVTGETDKTMFELGSHASRTTYVCGNAVKEAAQLARKQLLERAAKMLSESPDDLDVKDKQIYVKPNPRKKISVADVCFDAIYNLKGDSLNISGKSSWCSHYNSIPTSAYFAEVEVDTETGQVKILDFISAVDCGTAINPMTVEGQCEGGIQEGVGYGLTEDYVINKNTGVVESDNFTTYKMPGTMDMPEKTKIIIIDKPDPKGPFGAKGVGEPGLVGVAPAIGNAIHDATGIWIRDLPATPEKILKALKEKSSQ